MRRHVSGAGCGARASASQAGVREAPGHADKFTQFAQAQLLCRPNYVGPPFKGCTRAG
jgi:hypothetical protein